MAKDSTTMRKKPFSSRRYPPIAIAIFKIINTKI
jgi:hypothetical protein